MLHATFSSLSLLYYSNLLATFSSLSLLYYSICSTISCFGPQVFTKLRATKHTTPYVKLCSISSFCYTILVWRTRHSILGNYLILLKKLRKWSRCLPILSVFTIVFPTSIRSHDLNLLFTLFLYFCFKYLKSI